jgi:hypothetical protein
VFRVRRRRVGHVVAVLFAFGLISIPVILLARWLAGSVSPLFWGIAAAPWIVAVRAARPYARLQEWCSDPSCAALLVGVEGECPGCGGTIRGVIRSENERLAAEEALAEDEEPGDEDYAE